MSNLIFQFIPPSFSLPVSTCWFSVSASSLPALQLVHWYLFFQIPYTWVNIFSFSDLLHSTRRTPNLPTCVQMTQFRSLLWLKIFHYIYVPHLLHLLICWTLTYFHPGYCKYCPLEHWGYLCLSELWFSQVYAHQWKCQVIWQFYSWFSKESSYTFPQWLYQFVPTNSARVFPFLYTISSIYYLWIF